ncbi:MAG: hypothetical protein Q9172_000095 [Xanthocarpia lactea]
MGNSSSQFGPTSPSSGPSAKSKKSRRKDIGKAHKLIPQHDRDTEEGGPLQMQSHGSRHQTPQSPEDDAAASAQLLAESSLAEHFIFPDAFGDPMDQIDSPVQPKNKRRKKKKSKQRLSVLEASSDAGNMQAEQYDSSYDLFPKLLTAEEENYTVENRLEVPRSSYSLDEVNDDDEGVSSLFQEYESQVDLPAFDFIEPPRDYANSPTLSNEVLTGATLVDQQNQTAPSELDRGKKRKRKNTVSSQSCNGEQELLDGKGQHAYELDFEAFDEIFANEGTHQANPSCDASGCYDIPHGTELSGDMPQVHDDWPPRLDVDVAGVDQPPGKLSRVPSASRRKKRRPMEVPNSLDSQPPVYISPYAASEGHQDSVLPGLEDAKAPSSPEIPYSQPPGLSHGTSCTSTDAQRKETPPPRLEKPSKSRGNKKQRGGQKGPDYKPPLQELSDKGGMFRDDEIRVLENLRDRYCEEEEIAKHRFNELIHANVRENHEAKRLFNAIYDEIPYRTRQSVLRFCRRHFHNFAIRGTWTTADDERLRDAVAKKGTSWKAVGMILDRFPEDCRDRYRNYVVNSEKRNTDSWTHNETRDLVKAVNDCMRLLREERARAKEEEYEGREIPESEPESDREVQDLKLINWRIVSDRMGGTRSRLQCAYKFNRLKKADRDYYTKVIRRLEAGKGFTAKADSQHSEPWRLRQSMRKLRNMRIGDRYDFLQLFSDCGATSESNISWGSLGSKDFRKRWKNVDMKAALEMFKRQVPGSERMSYQEVINRVYTKLMAEHRGGWDDRWDPKVHGDINKIENRKGQKRKSFLEEGLESEQPERKSKRQTGRYKNPKSAKYVVSDDDEDVKDDKASEEDHETGADYDNRDPIADESTGKGASGQQSPEIAESTDEGSRLQGGRSYSASSMDNWDNSNTVPPNVDVTKTSDSASASDSDSDSDTDSDDSLFNGGSENELVERLQALRDA